VIFKKEMPGIAGRHYVSQLVLDFKKSVNVLYPEEERDIFFYFLGVYKFKSCVMSLHSPFFH
jgi:hypothetical protein